jgi:CRISPR-associated protein Csd2
MGYQDYISEEILELYEVHDFKHAAAILYNEFPEEFNEICAALLKFRFTKADIVEKGKNESQITKKISALLRPNWKESQLNAKLVVDEEVINYDTHKVDYIKGRVAFDLEWNSKDQTYDRDLYAFRAFFDYNRISVGVLLTRSNDLDNLFRKYDIMQKYGASTTQMTKLLPRLNAGRNGGCPILVFGITSKLLDEQGDQSDEVVEIDDKESGDVETQSAENSGTQELPKDITIVEQKGTVDNEDNDKQI